MAFGPPFARLVIDRLPSELYSVIIGQCFCLTGIVVGTYTGERTIAGPVIQAFLLDFGLQTTQIANRTAIYGIEPKARNRVNTAFMVSVFVGQLVGTAVGNGLYAEGGWIASGSCSVGFIGLAMLLSVARGPNETGWVGWRGGWPRVKRVDEGKRVEDEEKAKREAPGDHSPEDREGGRGLDADEQRIEADADDCNGHGDGKSPSLSVVKAAQS